MWRSYKAGDDTRKLYKRVHTQVAALHSVVLPTQAPFCNAFITRVSFGFKGATKEEVFYFRCHAAGGLLGRKRCFTNHIDRSSGVA